MEYYGNGSDPLFTTKKKGYTILESNMYKQKLKCKIYKSSSIGTTAYYNNPKNIT